MAKRKSSRQLNHEIASSLRTSGQPALAALFADPEARRLFTEEMRHELLKKQTAQTSAAYRAARPYRVKYIELINGRRFRSLLGNYSTEAEAQTRADQTRGWIEYDGRVIYGTEQVP